MPLHLILAVLLVLAAPAQAFETPGLDEAVATYRLEAIAELEASLEPRLTSYQRAEIQASKALILSTQKDPDGARRHALAAIDSLKRAIAANESVIASQFLLFKLYGQLAAHDWTFALKTRDPLRHLQTHAPHDRRTQLAEAMNWLFTPGIFGGNAAKAVERLEALHAERFDPETANLLALAYLQTGKRDRARAIASEVLARNPRDRSAQDLLERLR